MAHLYFKMKETMGLQQPPEVRVRKSRRRPTP